jgi:hypothetical protein
MSQAKAKQVSNKATKAAPVPATVPVATSTANVLAQAAAPVTATPQAGKAAAQAKLAACIASGTAAPGATALAHTWGQGGASVGNVGRLPTGSITVTGKGAAYNPKPGYNATAWAAIVAAVAANPNGASAAILAAAVGHGGAANVRYHVAAGRLAVTA